MRPVAAAWRDRRRTGAPAHMGSLMDLVAGDVRDIVLALSIDDVAAFDDPDRFVAHLPLGGGLDPTWLDLFAEAVRGAAGLDDLTGFLDARTELEDATAQGERIVERVDPDWIAMVAQVPAERLDALAGRWIELLEEELGPLPREEKPWIRDLAGRIVAFCRASTGARDVVFAWAF